MVKLDKFFRKSQANACPFSRVRFIDPIESVEDVRKVLGGNPGAGVGYGDPSKLYPPSPFSLKRRGSEGDEFP